MRLFHQLEEKEQQEAVNYCMSLVLDDMMGDDFHLEVYDKEGEDLRDTIYELIEESKLVPEEERAQVFLKNEEVSKIALELALSLAQEAYYHSSDEMSIFIDDLMEEAGEEEVSEENIKASSSEIVKKPKFSLN